MFIACMLLGLGSSCAGTSNVRGEKSVLAAELMAIFPGFFVKVSIEGEVLKDAVIVQEKAVGTDLGGKYLYVLGDGNVVEQRPVDLGESQPDGTITVLNGLDAGETYIVEGLLKARPGMPVTPTTSTGSE